MDAAWRASGVIIMRDDNGIMTGMKNAPRVTSAYHQQNMVSFPHKLIFLFLQTHQTFGTNIL